MRVLMILYNQVGRGTYWRALKLAQGLAARDHKVALLAISRSNRLKITEESSHLSGITVVHSPDLLWGSLRSGWDLWDILARINWLRDKRFDIIHAFESRPVAIVPALFARKRNNVPLIVDWCDWFGKGGSVEERPNRLIRTILRPVETYFEEVPRVRADGATVINEFLRQRAIRLGIPEGAILKLPNGSNVEQLKPIPTDEARQKLAWPADSPAVGYVGAIFQQDAQLLANSFDLLQNKLPNVRLVVAGYCNIDIRDLVENPENIFVTGQISYEDMNIYLSACDICWLPFCDSGANRGRFPLKLNDYMALGKPVVATDVGELEQFIHKYQIGLVSAPVPEEVAENTISLLEDDALRQQMAVQARRAAETDFHWENISGKLESYYLKMLNNELSINDSELLNH